MRLGWNMYLHEDRETFKEIIEQVAEDTGRTAVVIEKDYYVTMILYFLSKSLSNVVFKGGTSLSKGYKAIYIDKIFALCDYYIQNKSKRYSRHLYDIFKLTERIHFDESFEKLYEEVREHRKKMEVCPSAVNGVNVSELIRDFCDNNFYKEDYQAITSYFADDFVVYEDTISQMLKIADIIEYYSCS